MHHCIKFYDIYLGSC